MPNKDIVSKEIEEVLLECTECGHKESEFYREEHELCESCYYESYYSCDGCEEEEHRDNGGYNSPGDDCIYCSDCYYERYAQCESCDTDVHRDELYYHNDNEYCDSCYDTLNLGAGSCVERIENASPPSRSRRAETFDKLDVRRLVGIEVECVYPYQDTMRSPANWGTTHDGSINADEDYEGIELVGTPASGDILYDMISDVGSWAEEHSAFVNKSCGLHAHFDSTNLSAREVAHIAIVYNKFEVYLKSMMPKSRQDSRWCRDFPIKDVDSLREVEREEDLIELYYEAMDCEPSTEKYNDARYCGLNIHSRYFHGSLEFRLHSGTLNPKKIRNWIRILNLIIEKGICLAKQKDFPHYFYTSGIGGEWLFKEVIGEELHSYYIKRASNFNNN